MELKDWLALIGNVPFSIVVAFYLLYRLEAVMQKLIESENAERELLIEIRDALRNAHK